MVKNLYPVILAGGKGERFWPLSTPINPKPFLRFFSDRSLLQQTFDRARLLTSEDNILLVVGKQHESLSQEQLPGLKASQILLEPSGRDTAAAIGYASLKLPADALMLVMPADHLIPDPEKFATVITGAAAFVDSHGGLVTFGIQPVRPETNYGYVQIRSKNLGSPQSPVYEVERFVEKPDKALAEQYILQKSYYWNSGIFLWRVSHIQELMAQHLPDLWSGLQQLRGASGAEFCGRYEKLPRISVDFGIMEKADGVLMVPASFTWDDIGTWNSLFRVLPPDASGNLVRGSHIALDTKDSIIYAEDHLIATAGVENLVIVQRGNQILICGREHADRLKELLAKIPTGS
jgi:mannose-1-phosphate guanylyltransferase